MSADRPFSQGSVLIGCCSVEKPRCRSRGFLVLGYYVAMGWTDVFQHYL